MKAIVRTLFIVGLAVSSIGVLQSHSAEKDRGYSRWAIIAGPSVEKTGIDDLVLISVQKLKGVELVERAHVNKLLNEQALSGGLSSFSVSDRVKMGRLLGADALILLSLERSKGKSFLNIILSDCRLGARLRNETLAFSYNENENLAEEIAKFVLNVKSRFRSGISTVVGVSHFISKDFTHEHDFLQTRYAWVLGNALASIPGVAVIEAEEAHAIGKELTLSGQTIGRRIVPLFVEGEYVVVKNSAEKTAINFDIVLKAGGKEIRRIKKKDVPVAKAGKFLSSELVREIMKEERQDVSPAYSRDDQIELLKVRADMFALLGGWDHSAGLREAVLLLDPGASDQRIKLVQEYHRLMTQDFNKVARDDSGFKQHAGNRTWEWIVGKRIHDYWNRALQHIEYLVRNKQTTIPEITKQADSVLQGICSVRMRKTDLLLDAEATKKDFLRNVWPLVLNLDADTPHAAMRRQYYEQWFSVSIENVLRRCDGNHMLKEDLDLLYETLEKLSPEDAIPSSKLVYFLSDGLSFYHKWYKKLNLDPDYKAFLKKLTKSQRPMNVIYGRYGLLRYEWINKRQVSRELLQESLDIQELFSTVKTPYRFSVLAEKLRFTSGWIDRELKKKENLSQLTAVRPKSRPVPPVPKSADPRSMGRLEFEEIEIKVLSLDGSISSAKGKRWRTAWGWGGISRILKCGDSLDVFWQSGAVLFMRTPGILEEVFIDKEPIFADIAWDGKSLWIATIRDGIWIVEPSGRIKGKVLQSDGLPPVSKSIMLHAEEPGQVIAVGSFGSHSRAWCVRITATEDSKVECKIFHQATRVVQAGEKREDLEGNPNLCFKPHWLHKYNTGSNSSYLLVGRYAPSRAGRRRPLMIDLKTLKVSVFGRDLSMADHRYSESYFSRDGMILEAGDFGVTLLPAPGQKLDDGQEWRNLCPDRPDRDTIGHQGGFAKKLFLHEGWIYAPGGTWWRFDAKTFESERLVPWRLPRKLEGLRHFGLSAHYGIVAWGGTFYRITIIKEKQ